MNLVSGLPGHLPMDAEAGTASAVIRRHSASFALASRLLPAPVRHSVHVLYAYCRRADDAIDLVPPAGAPAALTGLRQELDRIYAGCAMGDPLVAEFQRVAFERRIPRQYLEAMLDGFELDVQSTRYATLEELLHYCWCVAGAVGAMMCHVLGVRRERDVVHGVHLGMAMQLTNICRDVAEDWDRGRLYVPVELLPGGVAPEPLARAVLRLLREADVLYRSGDAGLPGLELRSRFAVATARRVYSSIGELLMARGGDVTLGRAVVPAHRKLWCVWRAGLDCWRASGEAAGPSRVPERVVRFPEDVLPG